MGTTVSKGETKKKFRAIGKAAIVFRKDSLEEDSSLLAKSDDNAISTGQSTDKKTPDVEVDPASAGWVKVSVWQKFTKGFFSSKLARKKRVDAKLNPVKDTPEKKTPPPMPISMQQKLKDYGLQSPFPYYAILEFDHGYQDCQICKMFQNDVLYDCRVCGRYYHGNCLYDMAGIGRDKYSKAALKKAKTKIGWSCPDCDNIAKLLSDSELEGVIEKFDRLDLNADGKVTLQEFMTYHRRKHGDMFNEEMSEDKVDYYQKKFQAIDISGDGFIAWWEFVNVETLEHLYRRRSHGELVQLLKPKEVERMKEVFRRYDKGNRGIISIEDSKQVLRDWVSGLEVPLDKCVLVANPPQVHLECERLVSWDVFIRENALTLISARPNTVQMKRAYIVMEFEGTAL
ncbi:PHD finger protein 24-like [Glandiceps talaboti]